MASERSLKAVLTAEKVRALVAYDPKRGHLYWHERPIEMFKSADRWRAFNTKHAGKRAFAYKNTRGYHEGGILGLRGISAHRLIWFMQTGEWPSGEIDHINGVRDDNRWNNLREVSSLENSRNMRPRKNNISGVVGVSWASHIGKWQARIKTSERYLHLGVFECIGAAACARAIADLKYGFHKNHGRHP